MPKFKTIEQLLRELKAREAELAPLQSQRDKLAKELVAIDKRIGTLTGGVVRKRGRKPGKLGTLKATDGTSPYTGKAVRALRKKLELSQEKFGKLVGVSVMTVGQWERKSGGLNLRGATQTKLAKVWNAKPQAATKPVEKKTAKAKKAANPAKRAKNEKPLVEYVAEVLKGKKNGLKTKDIVEAVKAAGYKTTSKNFYNPVNVLLNKDKRFKKVSAGAFKLA